MTATDAGPEPLLTARDVRDLAIARRAGDRMAGVGGDRAAMLAGAVVARLATLIAVAHRRQPRKPAGCCPWPVRVKDESSNLRNENHRGDTT